MKTDFNHYVVGVDDSDGSRRAFEWACGQARDGSVDAVHAFPPLTSLFAASVMIDLDPLRAKHAELMEATWARPPSSSTANVTRTVVDDDPGRALFTAGANRPGSIIVVGRNDGHHRNDGHLGHVGSHLFHVADQPVVMVNHNASIDLRDQIVVVAVHGPAHGNHQTLEFGARLATRTGARLHLVSVAATSTTQSGPIIAYGFGADLIDPVPVRRATSAALDALVEKLKTEWPALDVSGTVVSGHPVAALAQAVTDVGAALVVVGNHHHSTLVSVITDAVLRHLPSHVTAAVAAVPVERVE